MVKRWTSTEAANHDGPFVLASDYERVVKALEDAHEELTDHGHEELPECGCYLADVIRFSSDAAAKAGSSNSGEVEHE